MWSQLGSLKRVSLPARNSDIRRNVLMLAWPVIVENLLQMMVGIMDTIMVGHLQPISLSSAALAAVGMSDQVFLLIISLFAALGVGTTALVAQYTGARQIKQARTVGEQSVLVGILLSIVVGIIVYSQANRILLAIGATNDVAELGTAYLSLVGGLNIFLVIMVIGNSILRGAGDTKTPMVITGIVNVINIVLDYILIYGKFGFPSMGVRGAALATVVARLVGSVILLYLLYYRHNGTVRLGTRGSLRLKPKFLKKISTISIPVALELLMLRGGQTAYAVIVTSLGTAAFAAHRVTLNAESLSFMPGFGFAVAATTLVGQQVGARNIAKAEANGYMANRLALYIMSMMGLVFFFFATPIVGIFSNDPQVVFLGSRCLKIIAFSQPALCATMVFSGALRGAGDTKMPMLITGFGTWIIRLPLAYLLGIHLRYGLEGAWMAMNIDLFVRGILMFVRYRRGYWKQIQFIDKNLQS